RAHAGRVALDAGAGALAIWFRSTGTPAPSAALTGGPDAGIGAAAYGHLAAAVPLGRRLAARLDLFGGATVRRPVIVFGTVETARWGPAYAFTTAGLDLRW
ncbi:MAG TPA: hypothetical protein VHU40_22015, partial [Polyangia bacterium]|nr:hypothetical protein [Polyangia bacterium]